MKNPCNSSFLKLLQLILGLAVMAAADLALAQCDPPPSGIVNWWPADGNYQDIASGITATPSGNVTFASAEVGQGFHLVNGCLSVPGNYDFSASNAMTIELWFELNTLNGAYNGLLSAETCCSYRLMVNPSGQLFYDPGSHSDSSVGPVISLGQFHHVAMVINGGGVAFIYLDGQAISASTAGVPAVLPNVSTFLLGAGEGVGTWNIQDGIINAISIYNRALSATEIQAIYNAGTNGKCANEIPPVILDSPASAVTAFGGGATFSADVNGAPPFSYQWLFNGTNLPGATNLSLNLAGVSLTQLGSYALSVSNHFGQALSHTAYLTETGLDNCVAPAAGLAHWWPAEGNGWDAVGTNNGTLVGGVTITNGAVGQGFNFDGSSGYVDVGAWNPGSTWTLEAWVNPSSLPAGRHAIFGDLNNCEDWGLVLSSGQFGVQSRPPGGCTQTTTSPLTVTPGTWYHVAATDDGTNASLYVNGVFQGSVPVDPEYVGDGTGVRIGSDICCNEYFPGLVDEVSFYNRALSDAEIAAIYAAGTEGKCENFPRVAVLFPNYNTTQFPTNAAITATFTQPLATSTLTTSSFAVSDLNHNPVSGTVSYNSASLTASFTPSSHLLPANLYNAIVTTNITATNGLALPGNISWQFSTAGNTAFFLDNSTAISSTVTNYDGQNLFIENCTVTIPSGIHPFGSITIAGSGSLILSGGTIKNATINTTNGGTFIVDGSGSFDGVTCNSLLDVGNSYDGTVLTVTNGLILNGTALVGNPTNYYRGIINFAGSQTLGGSGTVAFGPANGSYNNNELQSSLAGTTLTIGAGMTIHGQNGVIGSGNGDAISGPANVGLVNLGTISCDATNGNIVVVAQPFSNQSVARGINGGTLSLRGNWNNLGTLVESGGAISLGGDFVFTNVGTLNRTNGTLYLSGTLTNTGLTLTMDGNKANSVWVLNGGTILGGTAVTTNGATLVAEGGSGTLNGVTVNGLLDVGNTYSQVVLSVTNGLVLNGTALVGSPTNSNYGALDFAGSQTLGGSGTVVFGDNASIYNALLLANGGTTLTIGPGITVLGQNGSIGYNTAYGGSPLNVGVVNQGIISANVGGGTIDIFADPFNNAGTVNVGIGGPTSFGQIDFAGEITFAGTLGVTLTNGYQPALGSSFNVLNYGTENGTFGSYSLPNAGLPWQVNYGVSSVTLIATGLALPVVNITSPTNTSSYQSPVNITIDATATSLAGTITNVTFVAGTNLLGVATNSPYSVTWSNVPPGSYLVTASARDTTGAAGISSAKIITVSPGVSGTNFTWIAGSGNWLTPENWSPAGVPGAFDEANVLNGSTVTVGANTTIGILNFSSGTINGALLTISNTFYWTGGAVSCSLTIGTNALLIVNGGTGVNDLPNTMVTNYGTVDWASGTLRGGGYNYSPATTVYNYGLWNAQCDQTFNDAYGGNGVVFNNYGTFRKTGGASTGQTVFSSVGFNQLAGMVDVQNGENGLVSGLNLVLQSGGSFLGGYITTNTAGVTVFSSGNFNLNGTVTPTNLIENAGNLVGANVINGALTWQSGNWNSAGSVTVATNSTLIVNGGTGGNDLANAFMTNNGTVLWASGTIRGGGYNYNPATSIYNYGVWNAQSDQTVNAAYGGNNVAFYNYGTFRKTGGVGTNQTLFAGGVYFDQLAGVVDVQNGGSGLNLVLQGSGGFTGGYVTTNTAGVTVLSSGNFNINGTVTPTNVFENSGNLTGVNVINGALTWQAGIWDGANSVTIATNSTLIVAGGAGTGNNDMQNTVVTNNGTVAWASGTIRGGGYGPNPGTSIYNNGLWLAQSDQTLNDIFGGNGAVFDNYGIFRKTGGTNTSGTVFSSVPFNQLAGTVDVQNGFDGLNLVLQGGGSFLGGHVTTNATGVTVLSGGNFNINGTVTPTNVIENAGNLVGVNVIKGALTWQSGVWNSAASVTIAPPAR